MVTDHLDLYFIWSNQSPEQQETLLSDISSNCSSNIKYLRIKPKYLYKLCQSIPTTKSLIIISSNFILTSQFKCMLQTLNQKSIKTIIYPKKQPIPHSYTLMNVSQIIEVIKQIQAQKPIPPQKSQTTSHQKITSIDFPDNAYQLIIMYLSRSIPSFKLMINQLIKTYYKCPCIKFVEIYTKQDIKSIKYSKCSMYILILPSNESQKINRHISSIYQTLSCAYVISYCVGEDKKKVEEEKKEGEFIRNIELENVQDIVYLIHKLSSQQPMIQQSNNNIRHKQYQQIIKPHLFPDASQPNKSILSSRITTKSFKRISAPPSSSNHPLPIFLILDHSDEFYQSFYFKIPAHYILLSHLPVVCPAKQKNLPVIILSHSSQCFNLISRIQQTHKTSIILYSYPIKPNCYYWKSEVVELITNRTGDVIEYLKGKGIKIKYQMRGYDRDYKMENRVESYHFIPYGVEVKQWEAKIKEDGLNFETIELSKWEQEIKSK